MGRIVRFGFILTSVILGVLPLRGQGISLPDDVDSLILLLDDESFYLREFVAKKLGALKDTSATLALIERLMDENESMGVRYEAASALAQIADPRTKEVALEIINNGPIGLKSPLIKTLENIGESVVDELIGLLESRDEYVRMEAAKALGNLKDRRALKPLSRILYDEDSLVRIYAIYSLGKINDPRAVPYLVGMLEDENARIRKETVWTLEKIGSRQAVKPLIACLDDEDADVREAAAYTLGTIGDRRAVKPLIKCLDDKGKYYVEVAAKALGTLGDRRAVEPLVKLLGDQYPSVRMDAAEALGKIGDKRSVAPLISVLAEETYSHVLLRIIVALGQLEDPRAIEPLIETLKDRDPYPRRAAAYALKKLTSQDFGEVYRAWRAWWEDNKEEYLK
jgi:HEAT repeat protein